MMLVIQPNELPVATNQRVTYEKLREIIGNTVDCIEMPHNIDLIIDDEGAINESKLSLLIKRSEGPLTDKDILLYGTCIFVKQSKGSWYSLDEKQLKWLEDNLNCLVNPETEEYIWEIRLF